jgi:ribose transport system substrate-binding protein
MNRPGIRLIFVLAALVGLAALISACGSSGGGSSSSSSGTATTEPASSEGGEAAGSDVQAEAAKLVEEAETVPAKVPESVPLENPPPKGKTLAWLSSGDATSETYAGPIKEATEALGWNFKEFRGGFAPEDITNAMNEVVASKPDAFMAISTPYSILKPYFEQFKSENVPVVMCCEVNVPKDPLVKMILDSSHAEGAGKKSADWIIAEGGEQESVAYLTTKDFEILNYFGAGFENELKRLDPSVEYGEIEVSAADIGKPTIGTTVVSYLRAHPNVKYVGVGFGLLATGLPAALQAAGLNDVKLVALIASPESLEAIRKGNENWGAAVETGPEWGIWGVSVLIRAMNGEKIGNETQYPEPLLTEKNIPPPGEAYPVVIPDALEQYEKLWGI